MTLPFFLWKYTFTYRKLLQYIDVDVYLFDERLKVPSPLKTYRNRLKR